MFDKILIANRGEIACRVIHTARRMGIATVAVYSDADATALHTRLADEAVHIGAAPARESYLCGEAILAAAAASGAAAIHPGYGFLSENADFARACSAQSLVFIGPPAAAIAAMGSKSAAKGIMAAAGVPLVPGYHGEDQSASALQEAADAMGYPVLLKATAGGGGKGMREVAAAADFAAALDAARREASASFGDERMLVEKYLQRPRHVEIQIFFDNHGQGIYLAERDCSVQRRHQKVLEEAPAPGLSEAQRRAMGEAAVAAGRAIDYRGAGTVEFLLETDGSFHFMEMNTRLQVEHPVTEMITGLDLVEWQLRIAAGEPLPLTQEQVRVSGHALEARIYAEDPARDFLPATGVLELLQAPPQSPRVRVDSGVRQGDTISAWYDPMIAKLIVWDETREGALQAMREALSRYRIKGTITNIPFLYNLVSSRPFSEAQLDTRFIERHRDLLWRDSPAELAQDLPLAVLALLLTQRHRHRGAHAADPHSPWDSGSAWRLNHEHVQSLHIACQGRDHALTVQRCDDHYRVRTAAGESLIGGWLEGDTLHWEQHGRRRHGLLAATDPGFTLYREDGACQFHEICADTGEAGSGAARDALSAPMNGTIVALLVEPGATVAADEPLLVMEAMKMEHSIRAPTAGHVECFHHQPGDLVDGGSELLRFTADEEGTADGQED